MIAALILPLMMSPSLTPVIWIAGATVSSVTVKVCVLVLPAVSSAVTVIAFAPSTSVTVVLTFLFVKGVPLIVMRLKFASSAVAFTMRFLFLTLLPSATAPRFAESDSKLESLTTVRTSVEDTRPARSVA